MQHMWWNCSENIIENREMYDPNKIKRETKLNVSALLETAQQNAFYSYKSGFMSHLR